MVRRLPRTRRLPATGAVIAAGLLLAGCDLPGFGTPDPAAEEGESIRRLWQGFFVAGLLVGALVWGLLIYVLVKFRRRRRTDGDGEGEGDEPLPDQNAYNIPLEVFYTAVPVLVVGGLFGFSVATQERVNRLNDDPDVTVDVVGFQWSWQFHYPDEDLTITGSADDPPELVLPVDQVVHLRLDADDVAHSFWVPDFLSKRDLIPGFTNEIQVTPTETGSYVGRCAEYCGIDHWRMLYTVRVVSEEEYEQWLADARAEAADEDNPDADTGDDPGPEGRDDTDGGDEDDRADTEPGEDQATTDDEGEPGEQDRQTGDTEGQDPTTGANQGGGS
ncbi:MAG TPA: cytochrome c oxidase subunit II [Acidimicrobiales bacterium]